MTAGYQRCAGCGCQGANPRWSFFFGSCALLHSPGTQGRKAAPPLGDGERSGTSPKSPGGTGASAAVPCGSEYRGYSGAQAEPKEGKMCGVAAPLTEPGAAQAEWITMISTSRNWLRLTPIALLTMTQS
jgi:hypothetical protein